MNNRQLIILGNGFDLHCGLKSDYESFFNHIILSNDSTSQCPRLRLTNPGFWEALLFTYYEKFGIDTNKWCDIEAIIKDVLWLLCFGKSERLGETRSSIRYSAFQCIKDKRNPKYEFRSEPNDFVKCLIVECYNLFSKRLQEHENYTEKELHNFLLRDIAQELHKLEISFCRYLHKQIQDNFIIYSLNAFNLLSDLTGNKKSFSGIEQILRSDYNENTRTGTFYTSSNGKHQLIERFDYFQHVYVLSFNYTALFDILNVENPCKYTNVHGKLCNGNCNEDCHESNIIFGIDDNEIKTQTIEQDLRLFSKTYRKMADTSSPISILPPRGTYPIEIKFYGHSLNQADYSYFQSIFDYYDIYGNIDVKLIFYYSDGYEQRDAIYNLINEYGSTLNNKDQGKNLMHKLLLENRIKIEKIY